MNVRAAALQDFIASCSLETFLQQPLGGDASQRSYVRIVPQDSPNLIVMNSPPDKGEDVEPFINVTQQLLDFGYSAPRIFQADAVNGFLLLEDFGDDIFSILCHDNNDLEVELYSRAVDLLVDFRTNTPTIDLPCYDQTIYQKEAALLTDWYIEKCDEHSRSDYLSIMEDLIGTLDQSNPVLVLRDYHSENLIWLPKRKGVAAVGLLDYQDALIGHPAYDLVSLLQDARRDTNVDLQRDMLARYIDQTDMDKDRFVRDFSILGAQRNLKIMGIFSRLWLRDGKANYIEMIPRVWNHLQSCLQHPDVIALKNWIELECPYPSKDYLHKLKGRRRD